MQRLNWRALHWYHSWSGGAHHVFGWQVLAEVNEALRAKTEECAVLTAQLAAHTTVADATSREEVACVERRQDQDEATSVKLASPSRLHVQTVFPVQNDEDVVVVPGTPTPEKKSSTPSRDRRRCESRCESRGCRRQRRW